MTDAGTHEQPLPGGDVTEENTVFRDGAAVALIDFDLLRPSSRVDEVANLLLHRAKELGGGWRRMWDAGVGDQIRRREHWLVAEQKSLRRALRESLADDSAENSSQ